MTVQLIRRQAKEIAAAFWDHGDRSARFREFWPDLDQFVGRNWPKFVQEARDTFVDMLTRSDVPAHWKEEIAEALIEENKRAVRATSRRQQPLMLRQNHPGPVEQKLAAALKDMRERTNHYGSRKVH